MAKQFDNSVNLSYSDLELEYAQKVEASEMNPIAAVYKSLTNLGTDALEEKKDRKHIRVANFIAINYFLGSVIYLVFSLFWENWNLLFAELAISVSCVLILVLNSFGKINLSRLLFVFGVNGFIFLSTILAGNDALGLNYFFIAVIMPFLIFDIRHKFVIVLGVIFPLVCIYAFDFVEPFCRQYHLTTIQATILSKVSVVLQFALILSTVYQFVIYNRKAEKELESSNAQMILQTSELKRSNSDLEQFAYIISHDLKAPVRNISSFMNLLMNKYGSTMNPEAKEFVDYSHTGAKRLERLIDDVLAYCRIGTNLPKPIPVNLNDVVSTIRFELREKLNTCNGKISINKELPVINNVHSSLMYHVFQNLISNGLKFNRSTNPEISISWTNSLNYYTFSIADNGIGISKEYSTTIFQMFKRLHNEHEYDGTGIGLAICKKIVEYYHGEIWFDSEEGKGTTFHFTIRKF